MKKIIFIVLFFIAYRTCFSQADPSLDTNNVVYTFVETMPVFPGGPDGLNNYYRENLVYPLEEKEKGISGTVYIGIIIDKTGQVRDVKELRGVKGGPGLAKEAIRVIEAMPLWQPGKQNGKAVSVQYNLPVRFVLK